MSANLGLSTALIFFGICRLRAVGRHTDDLVASFTRTIAKGANVPDHRRCSFTTMRSRLPAHYFVERPRAR